MTDEHFSAANGQSEAVHDDAAEAEPNETEKATRNPTRAVAELTRMDGKSDAPQMEKPLQNRGFSEKRMAVVGIEQPAVGNSKTAIQDQPAVKTAVTPDGKPVDPLLGRLVVAWDRMTPDERLALLEFAESRIPPGR